MRIRPIVHAFASALVLSIFALAAAAQIPDEDTLAGTTPAATVTLSFSPGVPLLTAESRKALQEAHAKADGGGCYWTALGRNEGEAEALRAALAEYDVAVEMIILEVEPKAVSAEARGYCVAPPRVTAYFGRSAAQLDAEARYRLSFAVAGHWHSQRALMVRGFAAKTEAADPIKLGLDRAQAARDYLISAGLAPERLSLAADTRATGRAAERVEVMPR